MLAVQESERVGEYVAVALALVAALLVVWLFLRFAGRVHGVLRESGTVLITRIAGLLLGYRGADARQQRPSLVSGEG